MAKKVAIGNICSLMLFIHVFNKHVFNKHEKKHVFVFYLQINVFDIYAINVRDQKVFMVSSTYKSVTNFRLPVHVSLNTAPTGSNSIDRPVLLQTMMIRKVKSCTSKIKTQNKKIVTFYCTLFTQFTQSLIQSIFCFTN